MTTEKRLIDANAYVDELKWLQEQVSSASAIEIQEYIDRTNRQPTVDAVEVVHGRWEKVQEWATKAKYRCSICGREIMSARVVNVEKYPYCHCGAKMDGDGNG